LFPFAEIGFFYFGSAAIAAKQCILLGRLGCGCWLHQDALAQFVGLATHS
jgi:hypothetical protein